MCCVFFVFQAEDGIRDLVRSRGLGDVYKRQLLYSYFAKGHGFQHSAKIEFDYSKVRKAGLPIKGFGGISSGPEPLVRLHDQLTVLLLSLIHI